jgi:histidyl-tRNA synthetase
VPSAKTQPARGMRDFLPEDVRKREYVIGVIKEVYERYGFEPLETPAVENIETLMGKYGEEGNQLIFKILKRGVHESTGEADLALRYDLTVPLARVVAEYQNEFGRFLKRYQIQPVWRADRPGRGRFREFYQCDVDVVGSSSMVVEAEICATANDVLEKLGFSDFTIRLNHRQLLAAILESADLPKDQHQTALIALDKLEKIGRAGVERELQQRGLTTLASIRLLDFFAQLNSLEHAAEIVAGDSSQQKQKALNLATLGRLVEFVQDNETGARAIDELRTIIEFAEAGGVSSRLRVDPALARGLSYYTGAIMEISVKDLPGSLGGGGRYDNLIGMFSGKNVPACGFSLGLERIIVVMTERSMFPLETSRCRADVMIALEGEQFVPLALSLARDLRNSNPELRVLVYPQPSDKIHKQWAYKKAQKITLEVTIDQKGLIWVDGGRASRQTLTDVVNDMLPTQRGIDRKMEEHGRKALEDWKALNKD